MPLQLRKSLETVVLSNAAEWISKHSEPPPVIPVTPHGLHHQALHQILKVYINTQLQLLTSLLVTGVLLTYGMYTNIWAGDLPTHFK